MFVLIKKILITTLAVAVSVMLMLTVFAFWPLPETPRDGKSGNLLVKNVNIVDVETGEVRRSQDLLVEGGRIVSIGQHAAASTESLHVVDGTDRYLIPGLWDMHTHSSKLSSQYQHPLFLANGVTGVRDMWGCMSEPDSFFACIDDRTRWNLALEDQSGLSPRYIGQSSFQINGGSEVPAGYPDFLRARNTDEARELATFYADAGADFLKTYTELSAESYMALAREAQRVGLSLQGHRPIRVSLIDAIAANQKSIEHARLFLFECYQGAEDFRKLANPLSAYTLEFRANLVDEHDDKKCEALIAAMASSDTWWTPTLLTLKMGAYADDYAYRNDERLKYIPYLFKTLMWAPDADRKASDIDELHGRNVYDEMYRLALMHVGHANKAGVGILLGTDVFDTYVFPGFSVHDELTEFVAAGLSPLDALRAATINAATFSGEDDNFGSITVGKAADMILLNANPLIDIRNTQQIDGVFFNGEFFDRAALDSLLRFVENQSNSIRGNMHILRHAVSSPLLRVQFAD